MKDKECEFANDFEQSERESDFDTELDETEE